MAKPLPMPTMTEDEPANNSLPMPTEEEIKTYADAFGVFDSDGSGAVDTSELTAMLKTLGATLTPSQVRSIVDEVDYDKNGEVDFVEFSAMMSMMRARREKVSETPRAAARRGAVVVWWRRLTPPPPPPDPSRTQLLTKEVIKVAFDELDGDGTGEISKAEFEEAIEKYGEVVDPASLKSMFSEGWDAVDTDGNGRIDLDEFYSFFSGVAPPS